MKLNLSGKYKFELLGENGKVYRVIETPNLVVDRGFEVVARTLVEDTATQAFQYFAVGDNNTAPAAGDVLLNSEVGRIAIETQSYFTDTVTLTGAIPVDQIVGFTLQEIGIFGIDADATLDSGQLFSRALISPSIVKTNILVVNISYTLTVS